MALKDALHNATQRHKSIAKEYIYTSERTISFLVLDESTTTPAVGASMFADFEEQEGIRYTETEPIPCIWTDADAQKAKVNSREAQLINRYIEATVFIKVWLNDVILSGTDVYSETYPDRANYVRSGGKLYKILGYDRYGLGITDPYIMGIVLKGSYTNE